MLVEVEDDPPLILDLGTGLRYLGRDLVDAGLVTAGFRANALISHLHWDHIQGTPFFAPLLTAGCEVEVIGPPQPDSTFGEQFASFLRPPVFPVPLDALPGRVTFRDTSSEVLAVGSAKVTSFDVPHVGPTNGYRIDASGGSIAYISDHQQPPDGSHEVPEAIVAACEGVDVLIHDAQYGEDEFTSRSDWGHCTPAFAVEVARRCGASRLVLFHHDPGHDDDWIDSAAQRAAERAGGHFEVVVAREGLRIESGH